MWRRKTDAELKELEQRNQRRDSGLNPKNSVIFAFVFAVLTVLSEIMGSQGGGRRAGRPPVPFDEAVRAFPYYFILFFAASYMMFNKSGRVRWRSRKPPVVICNKCFQVKAQTADDNCPCGGKFELFEHWTWVKEDGKDG